MHVKEAITEVMDECPLTRYAIAKRLGKGNSYIYNMMGKDRLGYDFIASVADICCYDLALVKRDGSRTIILDKPE